MWPSTILFVVVVAATSTWGVLAQTSRCMEIPECPVQNLHCGLSKKATRSKFANQIVVLEAYFNPTFAQLVMNYDKQSLTVAIYRLVSWDHYKDEMYLSVEVEDNSGRKIFDVNTRAITYSSEDEVHVEEGFVIQVYNIDRKMHSRDAIIDLTNNTNRWLVTRYGLKNLRLRNDPLNDFLTRLDMDAKVALGSNLQYFESDDIQQLLLAITSLPVSYRLMYLMKYISMFPRCIVQPIIENRIGNLVAGRVDLHLKQDFEDLIGMKVQLKLGEDVIREYTLYQHQTLLRFDNIPLGVYSLEFRGKSAEGYVINPKYIEVKYDVNTVHVDFEIINRSVLMDQTIEFHGIGEELIAVLRVSYNEGSIIMSVLSKSVHDYFPNENYVVVDITTEDGLNKYRRTILGMNNIRSDDVTPLMINDVIKIYHKETWNRLLSKDVRIDTSVLTNSWVVTKYGLQNPKYHRDPLEKLMDTIKIKAEDIVNNPYKHGVPFYLSDEKKQLLGAIQVLPKLQRQLCFKKYRNLFPKNSGIFSVTFNIDYPDELADHVIRIQNDNFVRVKNIKSDVTFNYLPYGLYTITVPEKVV